MIAPDIRIHKTLAAVVAAPTLDEARAVAQTELNRLGAEAPRRFLPLKQAIHILRISDKTARRWCAVDEADGIAMFARGRWFIDVAAAAAKRGGSR